MSTLWTPDGERPLSDDERAQAEELAAQVAEVRQQLAETPANLVVANHVMGFYELAAIHLSQQPPRFGEAAIAIDAMAAVLDKLPGRLGENEETLQEARVQLQNTFVQLQAAARADAAASHTGDTGDTGETDDTVTPG
jgi:hypothetical protein